MCNCMNEVIKELNKKYKTEKWQGKEIDRMEFSDCGLNFMTGKETYAMGIDIKFKNQKKLGHTFLKITHCPLCGEKFSS